MKQTKKWILCLMVILICGYLSTVSVRAGGLNGPESSLIAAASGTFTYNGQNYVASPDMLNQAINYLCQDGVDLTQEQADAAIGSMYGMVGQGVAQGYLIPAGGSSSGNGNSTGNQGDSKNNQGSVNADGRENGADASGYTGSKSTSQAVKDAAKLADELGVKVTVDPTNKKVTITNKDGKQIVNFDGVIKNTGIPLDFNSKFFVMLGIYGALTILLLAFAVWRDKKQPGGKPSTTRSFAMRNLFSPMIMTIMGAALMGVLCMPAKSLFFTTAKMVLSNSVPDYHSELDSIYDKNSKLYKSKVNSSKVTMPANETHYAMIRCENWDLDEKLYFGDTDRVLEEGIGQYMGSGIPGMGKPILLTGHSNTFLNGMSKIKQGDIVTIRTNYGIYKYRIRKSVIVDVSDSSAYDLGQEKEELILYTCYPYTTSVGVRTERHFVYGDKVSGPTIIYREKGEESNEK